MLRNLFPNTSYSFSQDDTVALASFSIRICHNSELLGGHRFRQVLFEVHGVKYTKSDGSFVQGRYLPVVFEDSADSISFGREHFGYPSLFSDIDVDAEASDRVHVNLSWNGVKWASLWLKDLKTEKSSDESSQTSSIEEEGLLAHKYVPKTTDDFSKGNIDAEYDILLGNSSSSANPDKNHSHSNGNTSAASNKTFFKVSSDAGFEIMRTEKSKLPTLHHIVERLRELPIFDIVDATVKDEEKTIYPARAVRLD